MYMNIRVFIYSYVYSYICVCSFTCTHISYTNIRVLTYHIRSYADSHIIQVYSYTCTHIYVYSRGHV